MKSGYNKYIKILFPTVLAIVLFIVAIFAFIIPYFKDNLLLKKRELIKELTYNAISILEQYNKLVETDSLGIHEAQIRAKKSIMELRYGEDGRDYFWITDLKPVMVMHPYISELNNQDLSDYKDAHGKKLFVEASKLVRKQNQGYIDYMWQWKDDPNKIVPKVSFVKLFEPWGWIIGTGIYIEDVRGEINSVSQKLIFWSALIIVIIGILLTYNTRQNILLDIKKEQIDKALQTSKDKYKKLVEASSDGTLMILEDEIIYKNRTICNLSGYTFEGDDAPHYSSLFALSFTDEILNFESNTTKQFDTRLIKKDGSKINIVLGISKIKLSGKYGLIFLIKDITRDKDIKQELDISKEKYESLLSNIEIGLFRIDISKLLIIETNDVFLDILGIEKPHSGKIQFNDIFADDNEFDNLVKQLKTGGKVTKHITILKKADNTYITSSLSIENEKLEKNMFTGTVTDITLQKKAEEEKEHLIVELQASLLFMNQPLKNFKIRHISCLMNDNIQTAVNLMSRNNYSAILIQSDNNQYIGLVTDSDIRQRVVAAKKSTSDKVFEVMSSPLISISNNALIFEAMLKMQERNVRHLVVKDSKGNVTGILSDQEILVFQTNASGIILQEIQKAEMAEDIKQSYEKLPVLISALIHSGAKIKSVTRIISAVSDAITEKIIHLALEKAGPPPCKFSFVNLGSQGRDEQTLATDQDNAIVFENGSDDETKKRRIYFNALGKIISEKLNFVGYKYCKGNIMGSNIQWCKTLDEWKYVFTGWIENSNPQDLLETSIFFDIKPTYGEKELVNKLRSYIYSTAKNKNVFFQHLSQQALQFKPPISFFGNIVTEESLETHKKYINIKKIIVSITSFARVYALKNEVYEINTLSRLIRLKELHKINQADFDELEQTYNFLMILRIKHQINQLTANKEPDNNINIAEFTEIEKTTFKKALSTIQNFQSKLSFDFKGTMR